MTGKLQLRTRNRENRKASLLALPVHRAAPTDWKVGDLTTPKWQRCGNEVRPNNDSKIRSMLEGAMPTAGTKDSWRKDLGTWQQNRTQVTLLASDELARKVDINAQSCTIK
ncbi:hypothetical protein LENED_004739 [Lentinula edodes]|uniref:Uncharacterized protein n=1 Tax=Lentinula edodes TaxID=5353 RepID=A0A1Q3E759_LENED|nr:hypothetical protein LENED_004739 [Lentinula edodes]